LGNGYQSGANLDALLSTPRASEAEHSGRTTVNHDGQTGLAEQVNALLPSPRTSDANGAGAHGTGGPDLRTVVSLIPTPSASLGEHRRDNGEDPEKRRAQGRQVSTADAMCFLPTPTSRDGKGANQRGDDTCLTGALLPTPRAARGASGTETMYELGAVRSDEGRPQGEVLLPTPAAHDSGNSPEAHLRKKPGRSQVTSLQVIVDHGLLSTGGRLLPTPTVGDSKAARNSTATRHRIPPTGIHAGDTLTDILVPVGDHTSRLSGGGNEPSDDEAQHLPNPTLEAGNG
jgi:hypothetical protein